MPSDPVNKNISRGINGLILKYSAIPPQTPQMTLSVYDLLNLFLSIKVPLAPYTISISEKRYDEQSIRNIHLTFAGL